VGVVSSSSEDSPLDAPSSTTAVILGVSLISIGATVVLVLYVKWWKPRQGSGGRLLYSYQHKVAALSSPMMMLVDDTDDGDFAGGSWWCLQSRELSETRLKCFFFFF
jgi:hypothetical protein